jgi:hypothetical protein
MNYSRSRRIVLLVIAAVLVFSTAQAQAGGPPRYLTLQPPSPLGYSAGYRQPVTAPTYSWGWFGAKPRSHTIDHRGYYGERWQWRLK